MRASPKVANASEMKATVMSTRLVDCSRGRRKRRDRGGRVSRMVPETEVVC